MASEQQHEIEQVLKAALQKGYIVAPSIHSSHACGRDGSGRRRRPGCLRRGRARADRCPTNRGAGGPDGSRQLHRPRRAPVPAF